MELFKNTLYINLHERTDRKEHVEKELEKMNIQGERVEAIRNDVGAIGCSLSHIKCLEIAKERDYDHVFICEDDISFQDRELFKGNLNKFYKNNQINWDVLVVGGNTVPPYHQSYDYCIRILNSQTTTGYVLKRNMYDIFIRNFKESVEKLIREPTKTKLYSLDIYWKKMQPQYFWYMIIPPTVFQYESYSDIEKRVVNYKPLMLDMEKKWLRR